MSHSVRRHLRLEIEAYDKDHPRFHSRVRGNAGASRRCHCRNQAEKSNRPRRWHRRIGASHIAAMQGSHGRTNRRRRRNARPSPRTARTLCCTSAVHRANVPRPATRLRRRGRLPRIAPRSHPSRKTDDLQRNSRRVASKRHIRQRGCNHARRPVRSPSRIRNLGRLTSSPAASPKNAPIAISQNGPTKTLTSQWKTNSPR